MDEEKKDKPTILNVDEGTARAVCYIPFLGLLAALVFLVLEKNKRVRWDGAQAIVLWAATFAAGWILNVTFILRGFSQPVYAVGMIVIPLVLALRAVQKEDTRLPWLSKWADKIVK